MINKKLTLNWPLVGNLHIQEYLEKLIGTEEVSGTYIFNGPDNLGKTVIAKFFAQSMLCHKSKQTNQKLPCNQCESCRQFKQLNSSTKDNVQDDLGESFETHGDFHIIKKEKEKRNISVEQVRGFIQKLNLSSFMGGYKFGVIKHAENLSQEAANALLKTLEEPKSKVVIILVTHNIEQLPKTIVSRSQVLEFFPVKNDIIYDYLINSCQASRSQAKNFSRLSGGRPALALKFFENKEFLNNYQEKAEIFIDMFGMGLNERFAVIKILNKELKNNFEKYKHTKRTIQIWQSLIRDLIFLELGLTNLIQHEIIGQKLNALKGGFSIDKILNIYAIIRQADSFLDKNVNSSLVLEKIAISI